MHVPEFITAPIAEKESTVHAAVTNTRKKGSRNQVLKHCKAWIGLPDHARIVPSIIKNAIAENEHM